MKISTNKEIHTTISPFPHALCYLEDRQINEVLTGNLH